MNTLLHGLKDTEFDTYHGDTLTNDWTILSEMNPAKKIEFDAIVANPPFSYRWTPSEEVGTMAIILPHGVLFRGGAEAHIRTKLLDAGRIDRVIGLPANLFFSTGIPVCILVLKKCKKYDDVLFINASEHFEKGYY